MPERPAPDPLYVAARRALLDGLEALGHQRQAAILVGAHAVYLRVGEGDPATTPHTTYREHGINKRRAIAEARAATPATAPRVVVATGRCVGEGFDDARLDTLFLTIPVAWKGTLQQYAGRLHRAHAGKSDGIIYDYVDDSVPVLARMHQKRLAGYRAMGYTVEDEAEYVDHLAF